MPRPVGAAGDDGVGEDHVGETDPEVRHDDAAARPGSPEPAEERLPERRRGIRVAIEQARIAVGEELAAIVDEEQRGLAGHLRGDTYVA